MPKLSLKGEEISEVKKRIERLEEEETFEHFKKRKFEENYKALYTLVQRNKALFVNCVLKKADGLLVTLWKGGSKLVTLSNHEVYTYGNSELIELIVKELSSQNESSKNNPT